MLYMPGVFSPRSSFTGGRKLAIFLGTRPTDLMLCLDSIVYYTLLPLAHYLTCRYPFPIGQPVPLDSCITTYLFVLGSLIALMMETAHL
jgi:hypothetical protein